MFFFKILISFNCMINPSIHLENIKHFAQEIAENFSGQQNALQKRIHMFGHLVRFWKAPPCNCPLFFVLEFCFLLGLIKTLNSQFPVNDINFLLEKLLIIESVCFSSLFQVLQIILNFKVFMLLIKKLFSDILLSLLFVRESANYIE